MSEETTEQGQVSSINEEKNTMPPHINTGDVTVREISEGATKGHHLPISGDILSESDTKPPINCPLSTHYADPHTLKRLMELEKQLAAAKEDTAIVDYLNRFDHKIGHCCMADNRINAYAGRLRATVKELIRIEQEESE